MGSCTEELWPSFRTSESDGVWKRDGTQEELGERWFSENVALLRGFYVCSSVLRYLSGEKVPWVLMQ